MHSSLLKVFSKQGFCHQSLLNQIKIIQAFQKRFEKIQKNTYVCGCSQTLRFQSLQGYLQYRECSKFVHFLQGCVKIVKIETIQLDLYSKANNLICIVKDLIIIAFFFYHFPKVEKYEATSVLKLALYQSASIINQVINEIILQATKIYKKRYLIFHHSNLRHNDIFTIKMT